MFSKKPIKTLKLGSFLWVHNRHIVITLVIIAYFTLCFLIGYNIRAAAAADAGMDADTDTDAATKTFVGVTPTHDTEADAAADADTDADADKEGAYL